MQIFGAAGWSWTTANLGRISCFAYSLALYMATIGPLTHMQAERRAFWILRTVPVPLGRLLGAKARAWAVIIGGLAALVFAVLSLSVPDVSMAARLGAGLLVTAGAAGISFVAVAMASGGADLSDDTNTAVGPATIYAFLLRRRAVQSWCWCRIWPRRIAGLALYAFAGWTYWQAGVEQAGFCLDAEMVRARRVRAADGATMLIVYAIGGRALLSAGKSMGLRGLDARARAAAVGLPLSDRLAAGSYLERRPRADARAGRDAVAADGRGGGRVRRRRRDPGARGAAALAGAVAAVALAALAVLAEELVLRGVLQRSISSISRTRGPPRSGGVVGVVAAASWLAPSPSHLLGRVVGRTRGWRRAIVLVAGQAVAAVAYALTGRVAATWLARVVIVLDLSLSRLSPSERLEYDDHDADFPTFDYVRA